MEQFSVKISGLNQRIDEEQNIINKLSNIESSINSVKNGLGFQVSSQQNISYALKKIEERVSTCESEMKKMRFALKDVRDEYEKTERRICGYKNDHPITAEDVWDAIKTTGIGLAISALNPGIGFGWLVNEILKDEEWEFSYEAGGGHKLWEGLDDAKKDNLGSSHYEWEDGHLVKKDAPESTDKSMKKDVLDSITIWSGTWKKEGSLLHLGTDGDREWEHGKYNYGLDFMKAEVHAKGEVTAGHIGGELGVGLTAFSANAGGQIGDDMLGVHGSAQVDVGRVEAKVGGDIGWVDDKGNFRPQLGVNASAEAIAAEVKGTVGMDVGGTKVDVTGTLNFGIGAHADVGLRNGKFSVDVGASLGVGGSVKFEVDVSGTIDKVVEHAADIGHAAEEIYDKATDTLGDIADAAEDGWNSFTGWVGSWF